MKKIIIHFLIGVQTILSISSQAQVLNVSNNEQEFNQWCWAGTTKCILQYYGFTNPQQCDIAEFVRLNATFNNFGTTNCCTNANQGCNYWNYGWGYSGSIQEILIHFGNIQNTGIARALSQAEIITELQKNRVFVIRWGWSTSGGHFVVGHGINGNNVYFMNPWFGEGMHIGTYNFVVNGVDNTSTATHTWTHTNQITSDMSASAIQNTNNAVVTISPNPFVTQTELHADHSLNNATMFIYNAFGQEIKQIEHIKGESILIQRDEIPSGLYFMQLKEANNIILNEKIIIAEN